MIKSHEHTQRLEAGGTTYLWISDRPRRTWVLHHHLRSSKQHQESLTCNITRTVQFSRSEIMKIKSQSVDLTAHFKNKTKHYLSKNTIKCDFDFMWLMKQECRLSSAACHSTTYSHEWKDRSAATDITHLLPSKLQPDDSGRLTESPADATRSIDVY